MNRVESRAVLAGILLKRVREDRYPSATDMDLIEQILPPQLMPRYIEVLLDKVAQDHRPSISMIHRIDRISKSIP
ncbi:MAG TPA: hypothetical protein VM824_06895 [Thermoleophilaceae bacterium]|jgi:hypothetical protein|nr:hypothetical protein [Thermoleophilaceae bacterium]